MQTSPSAECAPSSIPRAGATSPLKGLQWSCTCVLDTLTYVRVSDAAYVYVCKVYESLECATGGAQNLSFLLNGSRMSASRMLRVGFLVPAASHEAAWHSEKAGRDLQCKAGIKTRYRTEWEV